MQSTPVPCADLPTQGAAVGCTVVAAAAAARSAVQTALAAGIRGTVAPGTTMVPMQLTLLR